MYYIGVSFRKKNIVEKRDKCMCCGVVFVERVILLRGWYFNKILKEVKWWVVKILEISILERKNSICKGFEVRVYLVCFRGSEGVSVVDVEWIKDKVMEGMSFGR